MVHDLKVDNPSDMPDPQKIERCRRALCKSDDDGHQMIM